MFRDYSYQILWLDIIIRYTELLLFIIVHYYVL